MANTPSDVKSKIEHSSKIPGSNRIKFSDVKDNIYFEYQPIVPGKKIKLKSKKGTLKQGTLNPTLLRMYALYRNPIFDSYSLKEDLAVDIKNFPRVFQETENSALRNNNNYHNPLYHYAVKATLGAMCTWRDTGNMKSYIAYDEKDGRRTTVGFVHFIEKILNEKPVV